MYNFSLFSAKLLKKNEINEGFLGNMQYFCIMKRNKLFFNPFFAFFLSFFIFTGEILAAEPSTDDSSADSTATDPMDGLQFYLLTCEPHDQVYSLYGHTALRVMDTVRGMDVAVNWGVFDPTKEYFVARFVLGLTDYMMATTDFQDFLREYAYYGSAVHQQHLNLTANEKQQLMLLLMDNARPENVVYRYNFYYNNCTTRARDLVLQAIDGEVRYTNPVYATVTLRSLIHDKTQHHPWARFGNDILLGLGSDRHTTRQEQEFIPDVLMKDFSAAVILKNGTQRPLVDTTTVVLQSGTPYVDDTPTCPLSPTQLAIVYLCAILSLLVTQALTHKKLLWVEYFLLLPYPVAGILLFIMLFSKHPTVAVNIQILIFNVLLFYLTLPKARWKYRWHAVLILCICFFVGNAIQSYAEGINVMALTLCLVAMKNILWEKHKFLA